MATLTDARFDALRALGYTGATSDMLLQWLQANGATSPSVPDAWAEMLDAQGYGSSPVSTNIISASGANYIVGTSNGGSVVTPSTVDGLEIYYFGSFGENFWNLRLGAGGTDQIPGITELTVQLGGSPNDTLFWNATQSRYQDSASASLWGALSPDLGNGVSWSITTANGTTTGLPAVVGASYARNDGWFKLLRDQGYTGALNDMELAFWEAGGTLP